MEKKEKGLADAQNGEFILNESGTAVTTDLVEGLDVPAKNITETNSDNNEEKITENSKKPEKDNN